MKSTFKSNIDARGLGADKSTIAHLGIAPGVVETMVEKAIMEVPGVAAVGGPKVEKGFSSVMSRNAMNDGVEFLAQDGNITLDIQIQIYYGYRLQDIVEGIRGNVTDALSSQAGITIDEMNIFVSALQFEE